MSVGNFERSETRSTWVRNLARFGSVLSLCAMLAFFAGCDGTPRTCTADNDSECRFCRGETCNTTTGICDSGSDPCASDDLCDEDADACDECSDDTPCADDSDACTTVACVSGACETSATAAADACDASDLCNPEACDATSGECVATATCDADTQICDSDTGDCTDTCDPDDDQCSDGDACNGVETCGSDSLCAAGTAVDCDDSDLCTDDACDSATGDCSNTAVSCDEGQTCDAATGDCVEDTSCVDDTDCDNTDLCNPQTCTDLVCVATPVDCPDDGLFCTGTESCDADTGTCTATGNPCGDDTCDTGTDACPTGGVVGVNVVLTTATDTTASLGLTNDDDTVSGAVEDPTTSTFDLGDDIDGLLGNDTLNILFADNGNSYTTNNTVAGFESLFVKNFSDGASTFSLAGFSGLGTAWQDAGLQALTFTNISDLMNFGLRNSDQNLTGAFKNTALTGANTVTVFLSGVDFTVNATTDALTAPTVLITSDGLDGAETIVIDSGGSAANAIASITATDTGTTADHNALTITGAQHVRIGAIGSQVLTLNAAANTGGVDIDASAADGKNMTATLTGADDIFRTGGTSINDSLDCGDGADVVKMTISTTGTKRGTLTSCETIEAAFTAVGTLNATSFTGTTMIDVGTSTAASTLSNLTDGVNLAISGTQTGGITANYVTGANANVSCIIGSTAGTPVDLTAAGLTVDNVGTFSLDTTGTKSTTLGGLTLDATSTTAFTSSCTIANSSGSTLNTGNIAGTAEMFTLNVAATTKNLTVGTMVDCQELKDVVLTSNDAIVSVGALCGGNAADELDTISMTGSNDGVFTTTALWDLTGSDVASMTFSTAEDSGNNAIAEIQADTIASIECTIADDSTLTFADFDITDPLGISSLSASGAGNLVITTADTDTDYVDINCSQLTGTTELALGNSAISSAQSITLGDGGTAGAGVVCSGALAAVTFTSGTGNDTFVGGTVADTISTGGGADSITCTAGANIINPGAGADTIIFGAAGLNVVTMESGDVDGTLIADTLDFTASAAFIGGATVDIFITADTNLGSGDTIGAAGDNVVILTGQFYANAAAIDAATNTDLVNMDAGNALIVYGAVDATSDARMAHCAVAASGALTGCVDLATFPGLTIAEAGNGVALVNASFVTD